jgi:AcrR family transcriptional regulator
MARPRDLELRNRLIAAATEVFAENGYAGANLDAIGERAGVTKGGVYFHFAGKEELFFATLDHWRDLRRRAMDPAADAEGGGQQVLQRVLAAYLNFHFREPHSAHLLRVLVTELRGRFTARLREDDRQEQRWLRGQLRELLLQGTRDGTLFVEDPAEAAFLLAAAALGVLEQWHGSSSDVEMFCDAGRLAQTLVARYATGRQNPAQPSGAEFDFRERPET